MRPITLGGYKIVGKVLKLQGELQSGKVSLCDDACSLNKKSSASVSWENWVYYPNTNQLRNQYVSIPKLGYPKCLNVWMCKICGMILGGYHMIHKSIEFSF